MSQTISDIWKPFKNDKNALYFMLKALSVLEIFTFLSWLFVYVEKQLSKCCFKIYDVTDWTTNIKIHMLPNIEISKGYKALKFIQLVKYNMKIIFLQKSCRK